MEQKSWNCIYHPHQKMRVVSNEEKERLIATGEWFDHPLKAKEARENYEKPIRRKSREGSKHSKDSSKQNAS